VLCFLVWFIGQNMDSYMHTSVVFVYTYVYSIGQETMAVDKIL